MTSAKARVQVAMNEQNTEIKDGTVNTPAFFLGDFGFDSLPGDRISLAQTDKYLNCIRK
jgi:hypothetical protein